jgi:membrane-bound metal-dependent hydrolase YbcI (DUF457 family)
MSPITHGMTGWIISQPLEKRRDRLFVTLASLLPDLDGAGAIIDIDYYAQYHHTFGHNLFFGLLLLLVAWRYGTDKWRTALLAFLSFNSHILSDLLGSGNGWGIRYLWPVQNFMFEFSPPFQWELDSWQNLLFTTICMFIIIIIGLIKSRTIVELFSVTADEKVVTIFHRWFRFGKR